MVESSDTVWSTGEGDGKPLHYSCLENPMNSMKRRKKKKKDLTRLQSNSLQSVSVIIYKLILKFKRKFRRQNKQSGISWAGNSIREFSYCFSKLISKLH